MIYYTKLNGILTKEIWTGKYDMNVYKCFKCFINKIINSINESTTIKTSNSKHKYLKEWISMGVLNSVRYKNALFLKVKKHPYNEKFRSYYIKYKN